MRHSESVDDYHLIVRPAERHEGHCYIHALIPKKEENKDIINPSPELQKGVDALLGKEKDAIPMTEPLLIYLTGWAMDNDLPKNTNASGPLSGAYTISVNNLKPLPPIRWHWRKYE